MPTGGSDWARRRRVGIIGGNQPDAKSRKNAEHMGRLIAENGYILVNGGMGGVMEASARGAKAAGGFVIGILPGNSFQDCNEYIDIAIPTGMGYMRNAVVVLNSEVLVAIDGSYGTLSEIAYAKIFRRTVLGLNTWNIEGVVPLATPGDVMTRIKTILQ
ncbi:MAG: TIGR00725 family protein [bacterium]|nr:TIGR00725 family protein [bacterium]